MSQVFPVPSAPVRDNFPLGFIQERLHLATQPGEIFLKHSPDNLIGNERVAMDQPVAKCDDPAAIADPVGKIGRQTESLIKRFPNYFELPLHPRPQQGVSRVVLKGLLFSESASRSHA